MGYVYLFWLIRSEDVFSALVTDLLLLWMVSYGYGYGIMIRFYVDTVDLKDCGNYKVSRTDTKYTRTVHPFNTISTIYLHVTFLYYVAQMLIIFYIIYN